jgi:hypothetical protein
MQGFFALVGAILFILYVSSISVTGHSETTKTRYITSWISNNAIPSLIYALHPVTLYFLLLKGEIIPLRFLENIAILSAIASTDLLIKSSNRLIRVFLALSIVLSTLSFFFSSPFQGACLSLGIVSQLLFSSYKIEKKVELKNESMTISLLWFITSVGTMISVYLQNHSKTWLSQESHSLKSLRFRAESPEPEMSPSWYLFSEIFLRQLPYFTISIWLYPFLFCLPMTFRLSEKSRISLPAIVSIAALFDPSGDHTLIRLPLSAALILSCRSEVEQMRAPYFWFWLQFFSLAVSPAMKSFWFNEGYGNANFMFNQHLIFTLAGGAIIADFVAGSFRLQRIKKKDL